MASSPSASPAVSGALRESQVSAAVSFLQNPKVQHTAAARKVQFLESKVAAAAAPTPPSYHPTTTSPTLPLSPPPVPSCAVQGLSSAEILESLRRALGASSAEYRAVSDGLAQGKSASEALQAATAELSLATAAAALPPALATATPPPLPLSLPLSSSPYAPYPAYYPPPPAPPSRDWGKVGWAVAAVLGFASTAFLLSRPYLPSLKWEFPPPPPPSASPQQPPSLASAPAPLPPLSAAALPIPQPGSSCAPLPAVAGTDGGLGSFVSGGSSASALPSAVAPSDRLGVRVLLDDEASREERLLRGLGDVRSELADIAGLLREGGLDQKRLLLALQQSADLQARERREDTSALRALLTPQHDRGHRAAGAASATANGADGGPPQAESSASSAPSPTRRRPSSVDWKAGQDEGRLSPATPPSSFFSTASPRRPASPPVGGGASAAPLPPQSADAVVPAADGVEGRVARVRAALSLLLRSAATPEAALSSLQALSLYLTNLSSNLSSTRYRKVLTTNAVFQSRVAAVAGAQEALLACGFAVKGAFLEWGQVEEDRERDVAVLTAARELLAQSQAEVAAQKRESAAVGGGGVGGQAAAAAASARAASPTASAAVAPLSLSLPPAPSDAAASPVAAKAEDEARSHTLTPSASNGDFPPA